MGQAKLPIRDRQHRGGLMACVPGMELFWLLSGPVGKTCDG